MRRISEALAVALLLSASASLAEERGSRIDCDLERCRRSFSVGEMETICVRASLRTEADGRLTSGSLRSFVFLYASRMNGESCDDAHFFESSGSAPDSELEALKSIERALRSERWLLDESGLERGARQCLADSRTYISELRIFDRGDNCHRAVVAGCEANIMAKFCELTPTSPGSVVLSEYKLGVAEPQY